MDMAHDGIWTLLLSALATLGSTYLVPLMVFCFLGALVARAVIYYTINREYWFAKEFEKRLNKFVSSEAVKQKLSFYSTTKRLLEISYYECFKIRSIMRRRKIDFIDGPLDRLFLVQHGTAWVVRDTIRMIKYLKWNGEHPRFLEISKSIFKNNPCFNRVFGVVPIAPVNDILNVLPGLFIVAGIFGTFLGIMNALPGIGSMDLSNIAQSKATMDAFLSQMAFAMTTSIVGIILSVCLTIYFSIFNPEKKFVSIVEKYEMALSMLWARCENNDLPKSDVAFDENKDSLEALAEMSVRQELANHDGKYGSIEMDPDYGSTEDKKEKKKPDAA